jgi:hypothetical protein
MVNDSVHSDDFALYDGTSRSASRKNLSYKMKNTVDVMDMKGKTWEAFPVQLGYLQHNHAFLERQNDKCTLNSVCVSPAKFYVSNRVCVFFQ